VSESAINEGLGIAVEQVTTALKRHGVDTSVGNLGAAIDALVERAALSAARKDEKRAPVQGYVQGIPWHMHLEAYDAYCKRYGRQDALIDLAGRNCRGGFGTCELDAFIPGWRERLSMYEALKAENEGLRAKLDAAISMLPPEGAFASGGVVGAGTPPLMGEHSPESIVPAQRESNHYTLTQYVEVEWDDGNPLIGELSEFPSLVEMIFGEDEAIPDGASVTVKFQRMTPAQYAEIPDWEP